MGVYKKYKYLPLAESRRLAETKEEINALLICNKWHIEITIKEIQYFADLSTDKVYLMYANLQLLAFKRLVIDFGLIDN